MFIGRINTKIDAKGRVVVPATFRKILSGITSLVARMDFEEQYLMVYTQEEWARKYDSLTAKLDEWDEEDNNKLMHWLDEAIEIEIDAQGRILIPKVQKERMNAKDELTFVGMGKNFAIWDTSKYEEFCASRGKFTLDK